MRQKRQAENTSPTIQRGRSAASKSPFGSSNWAAGPCRSQRLRKQLRRNDYGVCAEGRQTPPDVPAGSSAKTDLLAPLEFLSLNSATGLAARQKTLRPHFQSVYLKRCRAIWSPHRSKFFVDSVLANDDQICLTTITDQASVGHNHRPDSFKY